MMNCLKRKEYSASITKLSFWFLEFRKAIALLNSGKSIQEIKVLNTDENIFAASTAARGRQITNTVLCRIISLDKSFYKVFEESDVASQKLINLVSIMNVDSLFFDFVYEVYREKLIIGSYKLTDADIRVFLKDKRVQSERVAGWTDYTLKRLGACYKTLLMEAGVTDRSLGDRKIIAPIIDAALRNCLRDNGMELFLNALTGVR